MLLLKVIVLLGCLSIISDAQQNPQQLRVQNKIRGNLDTYQKLVQFYRFYFTLRNSCVSHF